MFGLGLFCHLNQNFDPSLQTNKLWLVFMGMTLKMFFFFFWKKNSKWPTQKNWDFQNRQFSIFIFKDFMDWSGLFNSMVPKVMLFRKVRVWKVHSWKIWGWKIRGWDVFQPKKKRTSATPVISWDLLVNLQSSLKSYLWNIGCMYQVKFWRLCLKWCSASQWTITVGA